MAIEVFMKAARAAAAHSNPHFGGRAIFQSCHHGKNVFLSSALFALQRISTDRAEENFELRSFGPDRNRGLMMTGFRLAVRLA
jgi:hypothetical protein